MTYIYHKHFDEGGHSGHTLDFRHQRTFHFDARRAGAGKTQSIIKRTCELALAGEKCLIVQPTTALIDETFENVRNRCSGVQAQRFHSKDGNTQNVQYRLVMALKNVDLGGQIILITQSTFLDIPFFHRPELWHVFLDETLDAFNHFSEKLASRHALITDHFETVDRAGQYARLRATNISELKRIAANTNKDAIDARLQDLAKTLVCPHYDSYVRPSAFESLKNGQSEDGLLSVFSLLAPRIMANFKSVTIAAARFDETFTYHWWQHEGVRWKPNYHNAEDAEGFRHPYNQTLSIYYGYEANYSKYVRNKQGCSKTNPLSLACKSLMKGKVFIRCENNDVKLESELNRMKGDRLIPGRSHGLNCYDDIDHAIVIPANNQRSDAARFLTDFCKFDSDKQFHFFNNHNIYQALCRTSIRNGEDTREKIFVVPSKSTADWLKKVFPGSEMHSLELIQPEQKKTGRPRKHADDKERRRESSKRIKIQLARSAGFARDLPESFMDEVTYLNKKDETSIRDISTFVHKFKASWFNSYFGTEPFAVCLGHDQFSTYLKNHHKNVYASKNEIPCVSGAMFLPCQSENSDRGSDNVVFVRGMWLDIENGNMTHQDFAALFPYLRMVAYSTFSHKKDDLRYRLYLPTNRAMTDQEYRAIYTEIVHVLETASFRRGKMPIPGSSKCVTDRYHGIDHRPAPCSVFALPCQAKIATDSFFKEHKGSQRDALDVDVWLHNLVCDYHSSEFDAPVYTSLGTDNASITVDQQCGIERAMTEWYRIGVFPGEGHDALLALYHSLTKLRLPVEKVAEKLHEAASSANSKIDRCKQADRLITTLKRWANR